MKHAVDDELIPEQFNGFVIAHVSDLHNVQFGENQHILLEKISDANPDIIVITGDLIDYNHTNIDVAMEFVEGASELAPIYYVTGNHEAWSVDYPILREKLVQKGVFVLEDESVFLVQEETTIQLIGLADPDFMLPNDLFGEREAMMNKKLQDVVIDNSYYSILLSHRPELIEVYSNHSINLVLSGHAHGGQFRIPLIGGIIAPDQGFFPKYTAGKYVVNQTQMIVSRGLGNSIISIRINNRPELVVIELNHLDE
ncbi:MAG: metallophosphoesterase [Lachnospiraceae bacterium]|nr:metallophosphoesterase [Lachnospiraceae bacterium]